MKLSELFCVFAICLIAFVFLFPAAEPAVAHGGGGGIGASLFVGRAPGYGAGRVFFPGRAFAPRYYTPRFFAPPVYNSGFQASFSTGYYGGAGFSPGFVPGYSGGCGNGGVGAGFGIYGY